MPGLIDDLNIFIKDPKKTAKSLVRKIAHSGDTELDKVSLRELKGVCKACKDDLMIVVFKECMECLRKEHAQVRVSTLKLFDFLFQKSHVVRAKLLDEFDIFLELTLAISQRPKVKLTLPPPKKYAALLQELTAKSIHKWHAEFSAGYEKLRYAYRYLKEHKLVDFSRFQVRTREQLIQQQKLAERQEKILSIQIENRMKELQVLKPEIEEILAKIESLLEILLPTPGEFEQSLESDELDERTEIRHREHGVANLSQSIEIEFDPYVQVKRNEENKEVVQNLRELKKHLVENKLTKLIAIEKALSKRSDQFCGTIKDIINLKRRSMNIVLKLGELQIVEDNNDKEKSFTLDATDSELDSEFEEIQPKEDLETYIPKHMRLEYGLESIDPKELDSRNKVTLTEDAFGLGTSGQSECPGNSLSMPCNVRLENGKLCPRRDKEKCPFHGRIIPRDPKGVPIDETERLAEEQRNERDPSVPEWQDPELLAEIKQATGVDLAMPKKGQKRTGLNRKLADIKVCDLTPKQRLRKKLRLLTK